MFSHSIEQFFDQLISFKVLVLVELMCVLKHKVDEAIKGQLQDISRSVQNMYVYSLYQFIDLLLQIVELEAII